MTSSTVVSSAPATSWWYGQGGAVGVVRRLEALYALTPAPAAAGLITARRDELTVTFVEALRSPLPHPWNPADSGSEARIACAAVDPGIEPDPQHPVYLVVFGTTDDGAVVAMNLAAFSRIRIDGDRATAVALVSRWVLELLATHPAITIGVTADVWSGPLTARVRAAGVGRVPDADVLICGPDLSYTDRAQIVSNSRSRIMVDLGDDAAVDTKWTISCGPDRVGQIGNGQSRPMVATLIVPTDDTVDRCGQLLTASPTAVNPPTPVPSSADLTETTELPTHTVGDVADETALDPAFDVDDDAPHEGGIDFFAPAPAPAADAEPSDAAALAGTRWPPAAEAPPPPAPANGAANPSGTPVVAAAPPPPAAAASDGGDEPGLPVVAPLWNRLLGPVTLCPPEPGQQPGPRERRLHELLVYLQQNPWPGNGDIIEHLYAGAAIEKSVTQHVSLLRGRLGNVRPGGSKALPNMRDGAYHLDGAVRSDWMEFERLLNIIVETTPTSHLVVAMNLVTGPPLDGVTLKEWPWTTNLRDQMRDRVAEGAVALARRHHTSKRFDNALTIARKGLWYDTARQDLWQVGMQAALDGRDDETFKALRTQYLNAVAGPDRDPAVFELTKQGR